MIAWVKRSTFCGWVNIPERGFAHGVLFWITYMIVNGTRALHYDTDIISELLCNEFFDELCERFSSAAWLTYTEHWQPSIDLLHLWQSVATPNRFCSRLLDRLCRVCGLSWLASLDRQLGAVWADEIRGDLGDTRLSLTSCLVSQTGRSLRTWGVLITSGAGKPVNGADDESVFRSEHCSSELEYSVSDPSPILNRRPSDELDDSVGNVSWGLSGEASHRPIGLSNLVNFSWLGEEYWSKLLVLKFKLDGRVDFIVLLRLIRRYELVSPLVNAAKLFILWQRLVGERTGSLSLADATSLVEGRLNSDGECI